MPMHLNSVRRWFQRVYDTQDQELDCEELLNGIPQYVDVEVAGEAADQRYPDVRQHLDQCNDCYDVYLTLRDVARLEYQQTASQLADLKRS